MVWGSSLWQTGSKWGGWRVKEEDLIGVLGLVCGWSMLLGVVQHGGRRVMQVEGWRRMAVKRRGMEEDGCEEERDGGGCCEERGWRRMV